MLKDGMKTNERSTKQNATEINGRFGFLHFECLIEKNIIQNFKSYDFIVRHSNRVTFLVTE